MNQTQTNQTDQWQAILASRKQNQDKRALQIKRSQIHNAITDSGNAPSVMWRLKLTVHMCDNVYYLRKYTNGRIQLIDRSLQQHALSNICQNAFEFETALEDAYTGFDAAAATRKHATYIKSSEII